jgi:Tol biopolymer transport system component
MQLRYFFLTILLFLVSEDFSFAQQSTEWTVPEGTIVHLGGESINDIAYSPDGELLAVASGSGIWLYDTVTHQEVTRLVFHNNSVYSISFSPDGKTLASGGSNVVRLWNVATGYNSDTYVFSRNNIQSVSFSLDGRMLAMCGLDKKVYLWDVATDRIRHTFEGHTDSVLSVAFNPSGLIVASAGFDKTVRLWNVITGALRHTLEGHTYDVNSVSFRPDGRILASAGDQTVRLWSVITGKPLRTLHGHTGFVNSVSFSPDGKTLASAGSDGKILLWSVGWPAADVNRDDTVNILDLVLVAGEFGKIGENDTDVNGDGIVNIQDLVLVAGAFGEGAAAPFALRHNLKGVVSRVEVQKWLTQAQQLNRTDPTSLQGIAVLEQLLAALTPKETTLLPNYPNPFNPETWIPYQLAKPAEVTLTIYDINGRVVRDLDLGHQRAGIYQTQTRAAYWDGRNAVGEPVASGVYFYSLKAGDFTATRKMLIRK